MPYDALQEQPSQVAVEGGNIIIDGPDGVAVTMTPAAAAETARRLMNAVQEARDGAGSALPDGG